MRNAFVGLTLVAGFSRYRGIDCRTFVFAGAATAGLAEPRSGAYPLIRVTG